MPATPRRPSTIWAESENQASGPRVLFDVHAPAESVSLLRQTLPFLCSLYLTVGCGFALVTPLWSAQSQVAENQVAEPSTPTVTDGPTFTGADGQPIVFADDAAVLDFLRTAEIVSSQEVPAGVNRPLKVLLEQDGVRMNAVLRTVDKRQREYRAGRRLIIKFWDYYQFEAVAYELSRLLGVDNVPPAVVRKVARGRIGSLQVWLEDTQTERRRRRRDDLHAPNRLEWFRSWQVMRLFDTLIDNFDRNQGNILLDPEWKMWWIDHTRAFTIHRRIQAPEKLFICERGVWDRLRQLNRTEVEERLGDLLNKVQIKALMARRDLLVRYLEKRIADQGEDKVLFDFGQESPAGQDGFALPDPDFDDIPDSTEEDSAKK